MIHMEGQFSATKLGNKMEYIFFIEGLNREVWQTGASSKFARAALWCFAHWWGAKCCSAD